MAIFIGRRPEEQYTRVPNAWARDPKLTTKAKGMLLYLLSHQDGYRLTVQQVIAENADGRDSIYKTLAELAENGYVRRDQRRGERGKVGEVDYYVADAPGQTAYGFTASGESGSGDDQGKQEETAGQTASWNTVSGSAVSGKSATKKTRVKKTKVQEDQNTTSPNPSAEVALAEVVVAEPVEGGGDEISSKPTAEQTAAAERLMEPYYDDLISKQRRRLGAYLAAALDAGWAEGDLEKELAAPTAGLRDVGAGLIGRIRDLDTPPANRGPARKICGNCGGKGEAWIEMFQTTAPCPDCAGSGRIEPAPPDDSPCPLHTTYKWHHCNCCWGDVKAGNDPFVNDIRLRPDGWLEIYKKQELAEERDRERRRARGEFVPYRDPVDPARYLEKL